VDPRHRGLHGRSAHRHGLARRCHHRGFCPPNPQVVTITVPAYNPLPAGSPEVSPSVAVEVLLTPQDSATRVVEEMSMPIGLTAATITASQSRLTLSAAVVGRSRDGVPRGQAAPSPYEALFSGAAPACPRLASALTSAYLRANPLPASIDGVDRGLLCRRGRKLWRQPGLRRPHQGLRPAAPGAPRQPRQALRLGRHGALAVTAVNLGGDIFRGGIEIVDPAGGSVLATDASATGGNLLVVLFDLYADPLLSLGNSTALTAELASYAGGEGLPNLVTPAVALSASPSSVKVSFALPTVTVALTDSSSPATAGTNVSRGELITLRTSVTVPEGSTALRVVVLLPVSPLRLTIVGSALVGLGRSLLGSPLLLTDPDIAYTDDQGQPSIQVYEVGSIRNPDQSGEYNETDTFSFEVYARVSPAAGAPNPVLRTVARVEFSQQPTALVVPNRSADLATLAGSLGPV
jgi:hypothetical protein